MVKIIIVEKKKVMEVMRKFGLTDYESRAYVSMIFLGPSKASDISREANVPQSKIYGILEDLMRKQLIEMFGGRPKEFKAVAPDTALNNLITRRESELKFLKKEASNVSHLLKPIVESEELIEGIWTQKSEKRGEVLNRLSEMLDRCKSYAYDITRDFSYSSKLRESIKKCKRRGVKLRTIVIGTINESNYYKAKWFQANGLPIKIFETKIHPRILVVDGREVSIRLDNNPVRNRFSFHSIWFEDPSLVKVFDSYMKNLWEIATPVDFRKMPAPMLAR